MHLFLVFLMMLLVSGSAVGASPDAIQQGQWVEVRGHFEAADVFIAEKITLSKPDDEAAIIGTVQRDSEGQWKLLQHVLKFEDDATFEGVTRKRLLGARVKVEGELTDSWEFSVEEIKSRGPGRDRIEGPVDELARVDGSTAIRVLGYRVKLDQSIEVEGLSPDGYPLLSKAQAPELFQSRFTIDQTDDDDRFGSGLRLTNDLLLQARLVGESAWEDNFNLEDDDEEDRQDLGVSARARLEWMPDSNWNGIFELTYSTRRREREDRPTSYTRDLNVGEAYLRRDIGGSTQFTVGRQDFDEVREWIYDQNLDALRIVSEQWGVRFEASVSKIFSNDRSRDEDATNYMMSVSRDLGDGSISAYRIARDFAREYNENSFHYGLRAYGQWFRTEQVWLDLAWQRGDRDSADINAYAMDVGGTWEFGNKSKWYVTAGLAFASGDDPTTSKDETFRQTGLQDNNGRFGGLTSFKYYGELSDPELSNLRVATVGLGKRFFPELSVDLVMHSYRLNEPASELGDVEWDSDLTGESANLGWETDVIVGWRAFERWEAEGVLGFFKPGRGFDENQAAWFGKIQLKYRY